MGRLSDFLGHFAGNMGNQMAAKAEQKRQLDYMSAAEEIREKRQAERDQRNAATSLQNQMAIMDHGAQIAASAPPKPMSETDRERIRIAQERNEIARIQANKPSEGRAPPKAAYQTFDGRRWQVDPVTGDKLRDMGAATEAANPEKANADWRKRYSSDQQAIGKADEQGLLTMLRQIGEEPPMALDVNGPKEREQLLRQHTMAAFDSHYARMPESPDRKAAPPKAEPKKQTAAPAVPADAQEGDVYEENGIEWEVRGGKMVRAS